MNVIYHKVLGVSTYSIHDMALIKGSWYSLTSDQFQCNTYFKKLAERSDAEVVIPYEKKKRGCGVLLNEPKVKTDDGLEYYSCMCHDDFQHPNFSQLIYLQEAFKRGTLPFDGCLADQPAQILDLFSLLDQLQLERDIENQKKQEAENKKAAPKPKPRPKTR